MIPFSAGIFSNGIYFYPYDFVSFCDNYAPRENFYNNFSQKT